MTAAFRFEDMEGNSLETTRELLSTVDARRTAVSRKYEPKQLNPLHHEILRRLVLGESHRDIAIALNCTPATVSNAANCGLGRDKLNYMSGAADVSAVEVAQKIRETAPKALAVIQTIIEDEEANYALRFKAATDILDRAGHGAVKKVDIKKSAMELSVDELEQLKQEALSRLFQTGVIIDVPTNDLTVEANS